MTPCKGRGLFATKLIKKGELLIVEKPLASVCEDPWVQMTGADYESAYQMRFNELMKQCHCMLGLKGIHALRVSYLYPGVNHKEIPPFEIYTCNDYKKYLDEIKKIDSMTAA